MTSGVVSLSDMMGGKGRTEYLADMADHCDAWKSGGGCIVEGKME